MAKKAIGRDVRRLLLLAVAMFGFAFAMVPLYDVFCDITGINGKTSDQAASYEGVQVDETRLVTVEFIARMAGTSGVRFAPVTRRLQLHPGEVREVIFQAENQSGRDLVGQAVPSVSPGQAALYLNKMECFCFNRQPLKAGQTADMPLRFYLDPALPDDIHVLTLSYTMYDVSTKQQG